MLWFTPSDFVCLDKKTSGGEVLERQFSEQGIQYEFIKRPIW